MANSTTKRSFTDEIPVPSNINMGLVCPNASYLESILGLPIPKDKFTHVCQHEVQNEGYKNLIIRGSVGPFKVAGLKPAVESLKVVMSEIHHTHPEIYAELGSAGMFCIRMQRRSKRSKRTDAYSSHSWGTAIDLTLSGVLDVRGNNKVLYGLSLIAPIFNRHGWYWGASFGTEDAMHFEVGKAKLESWRTAGKLGRVQSVTNKGNYAASVGGSKTQQNQLNLRGTKVVMDRGMDDITDPTIS